MVDALVSLAATIARWLVLNLRREIAIKSSNNVSMAVPFQRPGIARLLSPNQTCEQDPVGRTRESRT
jgi:hypothetical protein